ncbi:MAG: DUF4139 domain-containing protein [Bacteroidia bacterium]|nr:DUF4139 domain-containing protein [Bacteroidia bacterium]
MKKILLTLLICLGLQQAFAHTQTVVASSIKEVTVFLNGAQVFREGKFTVQPGISKIVFEDVSPFIDAKSIQATGMDGLLILDVKHDLRFTEPPAVKPSVVPDRIQKEMNMLEDSLVVKRFELEQIHSKIAALERLKSVLSSNAVLSTDSLELLMRAVEFYGKKTDEIDGNLYTWKLKQYRQKAVENRMNARLADLKNFNRNTGQPTEKPRQIHQIIITVSAERAMEGALKFNYLVNNAGWFPAYDLRANETNQPITITCKARVFQKTGENWDDVNLTLSTFNQQCFATKPSMPSWVLSYNQYTSTRDNFRRQVNTGYSNFNGTINDSTMIVANGYSQIQPQSQSEYRQFQDQMALINQTFSNVEFKVKHKYTIAPDGEPILMVVQTQQVPASFNHYILPKANKDAFLMARIPDWEDLNLLPGKANIYFENTLVCQTEINPAIISDTLEIAMGRDPGLVTTRKKINDAEANKFFGGRKKKTITIELVVRNTKNTEVEVSLEDQIPIAGNSDIQVALISSDQAVHQEKTGFLSWDFNLKPKETRKITFTYTVEFDKDKLVF